MATKQKAAPPISTGPDGLAKLREQYGCGPVDFTGTDKALYERHLLFDNVVKPTAAGPRERFEAFARSVRDILSQRWVLTEETYERENPKRAWAMGGSGAWRLASSTRWPRCNCPPWATAYVMNTASSVRPSRTAGSSN